MIVINFKRYVSGDKAIELARICKKVSEETQVKIIVAIQSEDLDQCLKTGIECWSQKPEDPRYNFSGTLLNHSDYPLAPEMLKVQCSLLKIKKCICVNNIEEGMLAAKLNTNFIAYEPHELIGSTNKSVSTEKPDSVRNLVLSVNCPVLIGAGIHSPEDIKTGLSLGAKGFLLATDVVKAQDPEKELRELAEAFKI